MLKTYTVRLEVDLVKYIDSFIMHSNQDRLNKLSAGDVDYNTLPPRFDSRSDLIERAVWSYLMGHERINYHEKENYSKN